MKGKTEKILCGFSSIFPKYLGKYARKMRAGRYETGSEGKFASRWRAKSPDALCAVLPIGRINDRSEAYAASDTALGTADAAQTFLRVFKGNTAQRLCDRCVVKFFVR